MLRLRKILLYDQLFIIILILVSILGFFRLEEKLISVDKKEFLGTIISKKIDGNYLELRIKNKNKVLAKYYFKTEEERNDFTLDLGDKVKVKGEEIEIRNSGLPNAFDYEKHLSYQRISKVVKLDEIKLIKKNQNIFYKLKADLLNYIDGRKNSAYLRTFIMGDTSKIDKSVRVSYQSISINHLLAISGTHVTLIASIILKTLKFFKVGENWRYFISSIFLILMSFLTSFAPAFLASSVFFILLSLNKYFYFHIKTMNLFLLSLAILLLINPFLIYNLGFQYHFIISFFLILNSRFLTKFKRYFTKLFFTSSLAFLASLPLSLKLNYSINFLSIIYNLFYVPFVVLILFPLLIFNLFFSFLDSFIFHLITFLESISLFIAELNTYLIFPKLGIIIYILYYVFLILSYKTKKFLILFFLLLSLHFSSSFIRKDYIIFLDVGQGDSTLISYDRKYYLIDAGGRHEFNQEAWTKKTNDFEIGRDALVKSLRSLGVKKLEYLFITHGDADHIGGAKAIAKSFSIKKVFFNKNEYNELERNLIEILKKKRIAYEKITKRKVINAKDFKINDYSFLARDENSASLILEISIKNKHFLLMGDAGIKEEKQLLKNKNFQNIEYLKIGHHGSKHSSHPAFLSHINPRIVIISSGFKNNFNHPHPKVLDTLDSLGIKYFNTAEEGSIIMKLTS